MPEIASPQLLPFQLRHYLSPKHVHLLVAEDARQAEYWYQNAKFWLADEMAIYWLSDWETLPYDRYTPHPDLVAERLRVLAELPTRKNGVIISSVSALRQRLIPQSYLDKYGIHLSLGDPLEQENFLQRLVAAGYQKTVHIAEKGEYAHRGAIVDIFPINATDPIRIEWFDKEIHTLRTFTLETQLTLTQMKKISILPRSEVDLSDAGRTCFRQSARAFFGEKVTNSAIYEQISTGKSPQGLEYYLPLFFDEMATLFDYLPQHTRLVTSPAIEEALENHADYCARRFQRSNPLRENLLLPPEKLWLSPSEVISRLQELPVHTFPQQGELIPFAGDVETRKTLWLEKIHHAKKAVLHFSSQGVREQWHEWLATLGRSLAMSNHGKPSEAEITLTLSPNLHSFQVGEVVHLSEADLHTVTPRVNYRQQQQKDAAAMIRSLQDLSIGSPVVHIDFGVGRYAGLQRFDEQELLAIEYAKGAKLYVPMTDLDLISKYGAGDPDNAPLHELGKATWKNSQKKIRENLRDTAAELLELYAKRVATKGIEIPTPKEELAKLAAEFPYEETPDQQAAISAVLNDLAQSQPMDRIICGDVGFGKTEVAVRAIYAAILAGYQVAFIAPTTLLADQHFQNLSERFSQYPVVIDSLSRFKTPSEAKKTLAKVKAGGIDLIIGTHRLLQKDVSFHNLGLVIVDEEQRFGVRQKEQLKALRSNINLLTLTATPIPRTLNLALEGLRDLSIIATPPVGRQNIQTILCEWDLQIIEEACEREHRRGGQTFFLHNDINSIERIARTLQEILPEQKVAIAHGQMRERELEQIMQDFCNRHYDILLTTTIIESGIDIPNANTILIHRADKLGLSQLHQLRGRVGRSHHQAYAYLITPTLSTLGKDAQRRLEAFTTLDSLGAGFLLASQDLEIRGAGEILGDEQSGQIQQIGISYYLDLLERTISALKNGEMIDLEQDPARPEIDLGVSAFIPDNYIYDPQQRLLIYQRLAQSKTTTARQTLAAELMDRFGEKLPLPVKYLFAQSDLREQAESIGINKIHCGEFEAVIDFKAEAKINPEPLFKRMQNEPQRYKMSSPTTVKIQFSEKIPVLEKVSVIEALLNEVAE